MTDKQIEMLRRLIQDEIEVAGVDGMEHGVWGWMDSQLDKRWKQFQESFMNDDMPWVNLTQEEVDQLRTNKQELTEYGKQKVKQLMMNQEPYPDEMFEEAERKELANKEFEELTKDEKIQLALEEIDWIVIGGQDGQEFYGSIQFLRKVLKSLV